MNINKYTSKNGHNMLDNKAEVFTVVVFPEPLFEMDPKVISNALLRVLWYSNIPFPWLTAQVVSMWCVYVAPHSPLLVALGPMPVLALFNTSVKGGGASPSKNISKQHTVFFENEAPVCIVVYETKPSLRCGPSVNMQTQTLQRWKSALFSVIWVWVVKHGDN